MSRRLRKRLQGARRPGNRANLLPMLGRTAIVLAAGTLAHAGTVTPALELPGVRVLVCHGYWDLLNLPLVQRMKAAGAEVRHGNLGALTADEARKYHLILAVASNPPEGPAGDRAVAALEAFVRTGGGLLFFRSYHSAEEAARYLEPMGGGMPWKVIRDPAHGYRSPLGFHMSYAYTDRVTPEHPVTEGVRTVWYNAGGEMLFHTSPLTVNPEWEILEALAKPPATLRLTACVAGRFVR